MVAAYVPSPGFVGEDHVGVAVTYNGVGRGGMQSGEADYDYTITVQ
jgi:hypothetical protein